jgi:hypothetical protein
MVYFPKNRVLRKLECNVVELPYDVLFGGTCAVDTTPRAGSTLTKLPMRGCSSSRIQLAHSLNAPGFNP